MLTIAGLPLSIAKIAELVATFASGSISLCKNTEGRKVNSRHVVATNGELDNRGTLVALLPSFCLSQSERLFYGGILFAFTIVACFLAVNASSLVAFRTVSLINMLKILARRDKFATCLPAAIYPRKRREFDRGLLVCNGFLSRQVVRDKIDIEFLSTAAWWV